MTACISCPAVTSLAVVGTPTYTTADFSWTASVNSIGYEWAINTSVTPPASGTLQAGTTYAATGLTSCTNYYFHVRSKCNATTWSPWSSVAFTTNCYPPCTPPSAGPTVTIITNSSINLSWPAVAGVCGYQYVVSTSPTPPVTGWIGTTALTASVTGLTPGTAYYAYLRDSCCVNVSPTTNTAFFLPLIVCNPLSAPPTVSNIQMTCANLSWNLSATAISYEWAVTTVAAPPASGTSTTGTSAFAAGLASGTNHWAHVRGFCGGTTFTPWVTTPFATPATCVVPGTSQITNITTNSANITWPGQTPGPGCILGYEYLADTSALTPTGSGNFIINNAVNLLGLCSGTTYYFHVRTKCNATSFSNWTIASFNTPPNCNAPLPPAVSGITGSSATFNWGSVSTALQYEYSIDTLAVPPTWGTATTSTNVTITGLRSSTHYCFYVRARCCPSDYSAWRSVCFNTTLNGVGEIEGDKFGVFAYPNPVQKTLSIEITDMQGNAALQVLDLSGKILFSSPVSDSKVELNMDGFASGLYILRYTDNNHNRTLRIMKQ